MSSLVGFDCNEGTLVIWFIIGGIISSHCFLAFIFMATEGKIVMVVRAIYDIMLEFIWEIVVGYSIFYVLIFWEGMTSVLYYYPIYELDRSAEVVGGYRFVGKSVFFSKDIDICRSSAILRMMYKYVGDYFCIYNIGI